ncbi:MAG TPA: ABC transporter permease [Candidatus Methanomethylia archaeon]|nr:ABC transporter permease [Candidatus Methanomethylicia archaeon]
MEAVISSELIQGLFYSSIAFMTPVLLVGVAEVMVERSGVLNLCVEGAMLIGAFSAFMVAYFTGSLGLAILAAGLSGLLLCLLFSFLVIVLALDQMVTGLAINLLTVGLTSYLYRACFGWYVSPVPPHIENVLQPLKIPILSDLPIVGDVLFNHVPLTYFALLFAILCWWLLFKTKLGLKIRAIGEDPQIAEYLGINVNLIRFLLLLLEGFIAGIAGSLLSIAFYNMFLDNMTQGRGYIAIALVILARWNPLLLLGGAFFFSFIDALQLRIQAIGFTAFPYQFALMMPYLFTIAVLAIAGRRVKGPASLAKPFKRVR